MRIIVLIVPVVLFFCLSIEKNKSAASTNNTVEINPRRSNELMMEEKAALTRSATYFLPKSAGISPHTFVSHFNIGF